MVLLLPVTLAAQAKPEWSISYREGVTAFAAGHYKEAISFLTAALADAKAVSAPDLKLAQITHVLAMSYQFYGDLAQAEPFYLQAKSILETAGAEGQSLLAVTLSGLGLLRIEQEKWNEAETTLTRAIDLCHAARTGTGRCGLTAMRNLGDLYTALGRLDDAASLFERAVNMARQEPGLERSFVAAILRSLGYVYLQKAAYEKAEPLLREAMESSRANGDNTPGYADSLLGLARMYRAQHDTARALPLVKKATAIYEAAGDPLKAIAWDELGMIALEDRKFSTAREWFVRSLEFDRTTFGAGHITSLRAQVDLAQAYLGERKYTAAHELIETALAGERKLLGDTHFEVARSQMLAAEIDAALHHPAEADQHYQAALAIFRRSYSNNNPDLAAAEQEYRQFSKGFTK